MDKRKITDGAWVFDPKHGRIYTRPESLVRFVIAQMESGSDADGILISAAPDMFEALGCLPIEWLNSGVLKRGVGDNLRIEMRIVGTTYEAAMTVGQLREAAAALSKATGQP